MFALLGELLNCCVALNDLCHFSNYAWSSRFFSHWVRHCSSHVSVQFMEQRECIYWANCWIVDRRSLQPFKFSVALLYPMSFSKSFYWFTERLPALSSVWDRIHECEPHVHFWCLGLWHRCQLMPSDWKLNCSGLLFDEASNVLVRHLAWATRSQITTMKQTWDEHCYLGRSQDEFVEIWNDKTPLVSSWFKLMERHQCSCSSVGLLAFWPQTLANSTKWDIDLWEPICE